MPNWCFNNLDIYGPPTDLQAIWDHIKDGDGFNLTAINPLPEALVGTTSPERDSPDPHPNWIVMLNDGDLTQERYDRLCEDQRTAYEKSQAARAATGYPSWYEWSIAHWGTKWSPNNVSGDNFIDAPRPSLTYHFDTAWAPSVPLIQSWAIAYPRCYFVMSYTEESKAFCGMTVMHGEDEATFDYDMDNYPEPFATKLTNIVQAHERTREATPELYDDQDYWIALDELEMEVMEHITVNILDELYSSELSRWDKANA